MEAVMRVRASNGLGVIDYDGFYCKRTTTDVDLPAIDCDKAICVSLRYEDKLVDGSEACVQCALLYTTTDGERRIRVHTMALPVTSTLGNVFRASDLEAQTLDLIRRSSAKLLAGNCSLLAARELSLNATVKILRHEQQHRAAGLTGRSQGAASVHPRVAQVVGFAIRRERGRPRDVVTPRRVRDGGGGGAVGVPAKFPDSSIADRGDAGGVAAEVPAAAEDDVALRGKTRARWDLSPRGRKRDERVGR
jgi:hypothetical protein